MNSSRCPELCEGQWSSAGLDSGPQTHSHCSEHTHTEVEEEEKEAVRRSSTKEWCESGQVLHSAKEICPSMLALERLREREAAKEDG